MDGPFPPKKEKKNFKSFKKPKGDKCLRIVDFSPEEDVNLHLNKF